MKILFLTSQFPYPPFSGGALRAHGLINGVVAAGHEVALFSFAQSKPDKTPFHEVVAEVLTSPPPVHSMTSRLLNLLLTRRADMARRFWSDAALDTILQRLEQGDIDAVHAESLEMAVYLPIIHERFPRIPLIYGSLNAEADLQRSIFAAERKNLHNWRSVIGTLYSWMQWRRLTRLESHICDVSTHVLAVSEEDQRLLASLSDTPVTVVKNGIPVQDYLDWDSRDGGRRLLFTGTMDYRPNVDAALWFAEEVLPLVNDAHLYIVGNRPHPRLESLRDDSRITVTGRVEAMKPYFNQAAVYIAPLRMGSGTRFKLMQAMAAGVPVVATTLGAMGLGVRHDEQILIADNAEDFAAAVNQLLDDNALRDQLRE